MSDLLDDGWESVSDSEAQRLAARVLADPRVATRPLSRSFVRRSAVALLAACLVGGIVGFAFPNLTRPAAADSTLLTWMDIDGGGP